VASNLDSDPKLNKRYHQFKKIVPDLQHCLLSGEDVVNAALAEAQPAPGPAGLAEIEARPRRRCKPCCLQVRTKKLVGNLKKVIIVYLFIYV
jgi:hypothetical protein